MVMLAFYIESQMWDSVNPILQVGRTHHYYNYKLEVPIKMNFLKMISEFAARGSCNLTRKCIWNISCKFIWIERIIFFTYTHKIINDLNGSNYKYKYAFILEF